MGVFLILFGITQISSQTDASDEIRDGGFLSEETCGPPCFLGIIPNVTKEAEAIRILKERGLYKNCKFVNNESGSGLRVLNCLKHQVSVTFFPGTDVVGEIRFSLIQEVTVDMVIAKYGEPDSVFVSSMRFPWTKRLETFMALIYNDINTSVNLGAQNGNTFNLKSSTPVSSIGYSKLGFPSVGEGETGKKYLSAWHDYGEYEDLMNP